jgi:hypothetical protein
MTAFAAWAEKSFWSHAGYIKDRDAARLSVFKEWSKTLLSRCIPYVLKISARWSCHLSQHGSSERNSSMSSGLIRAKRAGVIVCAPESSVILDL